MLITKQKIIVILGPTATGKSDLAVEVALHVNGEVISADSRQVYKGLDIGTGKITTPEMKGVPHHLLDVVEPTERFTVMDWKVAAERAIVDIVSRGKIPIICGGTGFYISALVDNLSFPEVEADPEEQKALEAKSSDELMAELAELDPDRASAVDPYNKRRIARAIQIARRLGRVPAIAADPDAKFDPLMVGVIVPDEELKSRIRARLIRRIESGMIDEAARLHANGLSYERMDELGLEYRYLAHYLQQKLSREEFIEVLATKIWQYARRQKTWFKRDTRITWYNPAQQSHIPSQIDLWMKK